jgi:tetratricopeptide (TPR) repeat protein
MQREPNKRPRSAMALLEELESIHRLHSGETPEQCIWQFMNSAGNGKTIYNFGRRPPGILPIIAGSIGAVILIGAGIVFMQSTDRRAPPLPVAAQTAAQEQVKTPTVVSLPAPIPEKSEFAAHAAKAVFPKPKPFGRALEKANSAPVALKSPVIPHKATGEGDLLENFIKHVEAGNYAVALSLFDSLPPGAASDKMAQILRVRATFALGKLEETRSILDGLVMDDGELFLIKARLLLGRGETVQALQCLEKSIQIKARMIDADALRREYFFYRALCVTRQYEDSPNEDARKNALDGWFEVKNLLRKYPDDAYFRKAVLEMQKMSAAALPLKGKGS